MSRVFISHATSDRRFVKDELCALLRALGLDAWYAEEDIQTAQHWERAILKGLEESKWFCLVMSSRSADSEWIKDEVNWAIEERAEHLIPILIDDCDAKRFHIRLPRIQHLDFRDINRAARERLVSLIVDREYKRNSYAGSQALYPGIAAIIRASDLPMFFLDNEMNFKFYNDRLTTLLGFKKNELNGQSGLMIVNRFISLAPERTREQLRAKQELLKELPDHAEEDDIIDLRHRAGNRYQGLQRVWISADRIYDPITEEPVGSLIVYRVCSIQP